MDSTRARPSDQDQHRSAPPFRTAGVLAVSTGHFIHDVYSSFLPPLLPLLIEKLGMSLTRAGLLATVMQVPSLANPLLGSWLDRKGLQRLLVVAPALTAVSMCLLGLASGYGWLVLLLLVAGVSVALWHVPAPVVVADMAGKQVGRGMGFFMTGGELARAVGPMVAVGAVSWLGLEGYYPLMIGGLLASVWLHIQLGPRVSRTGPKRGGSVAHAWQEVRHVLVPLTGVLVARAFMHAAMSTFLPTFLEQQTGNLWLAGAGLTLLEAFGVIGVFTAGTLSDRIGRRAVIRLSILGAPAGMLLFVCCGGWPRVVAVALTGFLLLSSMPAMLAMVQEHARDNRAAANGFFIMISSLTRSIVVIPVGMIGDAFGLEAAYYAGAVVGWLALPFLLQLPDSPGARGTSAGPPRGDG